MKDLISVIVPIYNIKDYIERCVNSIINQTYKNLQIILVDDGSTDGSSEVCEKFAQSDKRIEVIHKKNGGLSSARNAGIEHAKGSFISFIDGDDEIETNMIERLYGEIVDTKSDLSICRIEKIEKDRRFPIRDFPNETSRLIMDADEALRLFFLDILDCSSCNKLYKKELFDNIQFPFGRLNEDFAVLYRLFFISKQIVYIPDILYHYYFRENSNTSKEFDETQFDKIDNAIEAVEYIRTNKKNLTRYSKYYLYRQCFFLINTMNEKKITNKFLKRYKHILHILKTGCFDIFFCNHLSFKEKMAYIIASFLPRLYFKRYK